MVVTMMVILMAEVDGRVSFDDGDYEADDDDQTTMMMTMMERK